MSMKLSASARRAAVVTILNTVKNIDGYKCTINELEVYLEEKDECYGDIELTYTNSDGQKSLVWGCNGLISEEMIVNLRENIDHQQALAMFEAAKPLAISVGAKLDVGAENAFLDTTEKFSLEVEDDCGQISYPATIRGAQQVLERLDRVKAVQMLGMHALEFLNKHIVVTVDTERNRIFVDADDTLVTTPRQKRYAVAGGVRIPAPTKTVELPAMFTFTSAGAAKAIALIKASSVLDHEYDVPDDIPEDIEPASEADVGDYSPPEGTL